MASHVLLEDKANNSFPLSQEEDREVFWWSGGKWRQLKLTFQRSFGDSPSFPPPLLPTTVWKGKPPEKLFRRLRIAVYHVVQPFSLKEEEEGGIGCCFAPSRLLPPPLFPSLDLPTLPS